MATVKAIAASQILDSRGNPAVKVSVELSDGSTTFSSVIFDNTSHDKKQEEKAEAGPLAVVQEAIDTITKRIAPAVVGMDISHPQAIDQVLIQIREENTGQNNAVRASVAVSQAILRAAAGYAHIPLASYIAQLAGRNEEEFQMPIPLFNVLEGGKNASNQLDFQEYLVIPASSKTFQEAMQIGTVIYKALEEVLRERNMSTAITEQGGYAPTLPTNIEGLSFVKIAIDSTIYRFSFDLFMGLDVAADRFASGNKYKLKDKSSFYSSEELTRLYEQLVHDYSIIYMEDAFGNNDWDGWKKGHEKIGNRVLMVGDELTVTNPYQLQLAIENKAINAISIKPSQIGTVSESIAVAAMARSKDMKIVVSESKTNTEDTFLADFALGIGCDYVKFGPPMQEWTLKYNRMLEIQEERKAFRG